LNPIFSSASNHRYHTYDFYNVDPLLGGNDVLRVSCWPKPINAA
jgi:neopullulanase